MFGVLFVRRCKIFASNIVMWVRLCLAFSFYLCHGRLLKFLDQIYRVFTFSSEVLSLVSLVETLVTWLLEKLGVLAVLANFWFSPSCQVYGRNLSQICC